MKRWPREGHADAMPLWAVLLTLAAFFAGLALTLALP